MKVSDASTDIDGVNLNATSKYIISTSGRIASCERYKKLISLLKLNIVYIPTHAMNPNKPLIDPSEYCSALRELPCLGGAISKDIKQSIVPHLDYIDPTARQYIAINTVIRYQPGETIINTSNIGRRDSKIKDINEDNNVNNINIKIFNDTEQDILVGYNTDVLGFEYAISNCLRRNTLSLSSAVVYGYGGVTNVVVGVLKRMGLKVYITGRNPISITKKAKDLDIAIYTPQVFCDLFVNATPVTDKPLNLAENFVETLVSSQCKVIFDHELHGVYLARYCREHFLTHISGMDMYEPQMVFQWTL